MGEPSGKTAICNAYEKFVILGNTCTQKSRVFNDRKLIVDCKLEQAILFLELQVVHFTMLSDSSWLHDAGLSDFILCGQER